MVATLIFILHFVFAIILFLKNKKDGLGDGFLAVAFFGILFAVGWTVFTQLVNLIFLIEWVDKFYWQPVESDFIYKLRKEFSRETLSLSLLTICEAVFYFKFLSSKNKNDKPEVGK